MKKYTLIALLLFLPFIVQARYHRPAPTPTPPPVVVTPAPSTSLTLGAFNANVGTVQVTFVGWNDDVPKCVSGKTSFIYWENYGVSLDSIINGSQDYVIRQFGAKLCQGSILSLFHEPNGNWDSWGGTVGNNTPNKVISAYKHIHDIIGTKVKYAFVVNNDSVPNTANNQIVNYYPGSAYVDIVGIDAFNFGGQSFASAVPQSLVTLMSFYGKPVWLTSVGTADNQTKFVTDMMSNVKKMGISGIIYFDADQFTLPTSVLSLIK